MDEKEKNVVKIVKEHITSFACELGYSYLNAGCSKWENGKGETIKLDSMENAYLKNCVSFVADGIKELENGKMDVEIEKKVISFSRKYDEDNELKGKHLKATEKIVENIRKDVIKELKEKKKELECYL